MAIWPGPSRRWVFFEKNPRMIDGKRVLGVIPARGGSKGIPGKNIRPLGGKPLIAWTIEAGKRSAHLDRLVLSSDDDDIARVAEECGCEVPFRRPAELARDDTPGVEPPLHALAMLPGYDYVVLLQPTSPFRIAADIDACLEKCVAEKAPACVSVVEASQSPYWTYIMTVQGRLRPCVKDAPVFARRQDVPPAYVLNGAVYAAEAAYLNEKRSFLGEETVAHIMPRERSPDLDTMLDWQFAEFMMAETA